MAKNSIADIAALVARKQKISKKEAADIVTTFFRIITEGLHEDRVVKVRGLGTFKVTTVKARESVNINTGERVIIEEHDKVSFVPDTAMKELVNKPFAQFTTVPVNEGVSFDSIDAASDAEERKLSVSNEPESTESEVEEDEESSDVEEEVVETPSEPETTEEDETESKVEEPSSVVDEPAVESTVISSEVEPSSETLIENKPSDKEIFAESVSSKESEPVVEEVHHNSPLVQETPAPVQEAPLTVEENPKEQTEKQSDEESNDEEDGEHVSREYFDEQMDACRHRCNRNLVLSLVLLVVGLVAGFFIGRYALPMINSDKPVAKVVSQKKAEPKPVEPVQQDTVKDSVPQQDTIALAPKKEEPKVEEEEEKPEEKVEKEDVPTDMATLNKDRRLRFGAYEITGIDKVVKLKKGQTMQSYSNKTLGKDMVVYFQVLNGVDELKPGDEMKVPKIRLKKQYRKK